MAFNGAGTFQTLSYPNYPAVAGSLIKASMFNANITDLVNGLTNCVTRDGQSPATANLPMGGKKHTNVAQAVATTDYARFDQVIPVDTVTGNATLGGTNTGGVLELYKAQNAPSFAKVINNTVGASASARWDLATGTANSYLLHYLADNNGSPYAGFSAGPAVTGWRMNLGGSDRWFIDATTGNVGVGVTPLTNIRNYKAFTGTSNTAAEYSDYSYIVTASPSGAYNKVGVMGEARVATGYTGTGTHIGVWGNVTLQNAVTTTSLIGVNASVGTSGAGAVTTASGISAGVTNGGAAAITNAVGVGINDLTAGTSNFGLYNSVTSGANKWGYYGAGDANNYFAGAVGIGTGPSGGLLDIRKDQDAVTYVKVLNNNTTTNATARLDLATGTANSYLRLVAYDNAGTPYGQLNAGSALSDIRVAFNGVAKFQWAANGAIGLSGANYGNVGDVLTSQGSSAAPVWSPAGGGMAAGVVAAFAGSAAPTGWLLCYGQAVSRTTYATLFTAIGTTYGVGDGSTTFNLPDLRGRNPRGLDNMGGTAANRVTAGGSGIAGTTLGAVGGAETVTLSLAQMPVHDHSYTAPVFVSNIGNANKGGTVNSTTGATTGTNGSGQAHQNMPPTIMMNYIIKT